MRTFHGLHHWTKHTFEHLGWMVLAQERGHNDKIMCYKNSLKRLRESLENELKVMEDNDRRRDLEVLLENVEILQNFVNKTLTGKKSTKSKSRKTSKQSWLF